MTYIEKRLIWILKVCWRVVTTIIVECMREFWIVTYCTVVVWGGEKSKYNVKDLYWTLILQLSPFFDIWPKWTYADRLPLFVLSNPFHPHIIYIAYRGIV